MTTIQFQDNFTVRIVGSGGVADELTEYYDSLIITDFSKEPDLICKVSNFDCSPEYILGGSDDYFGRRGDWFLRVDKYKKIRIRCDWTELHVTPRVPRDWVYKLIEFRARQKLSEEGLTLIHASGATINDTSLVFPAWRHTGKTNTLLTLLKEYDGKYLSDDRLWVDNNGKAHGFSLPVNMLPYNYRAFPDIESPSRQYDIRHNLSTVIDKNTSNTGSFFSQALYFVNFFYISPPNIKMKLGELFDDTGFVEQAEVDALIFLQTVDNSSGQRRVELTDIEPEQGVSRLKAISEREWNRFIREYATAYDLLFENSTMVKHLDKLIETEHELWTKATKSADVYLLTIPREDDWLNSNISKKLLSELDSVIH